LTGFLHQLETYNLCISVTVTAAPAEPVWRLITTNLAKHFIQANLSIDSFDLHSLTTQYDGSPFVFLVGGNKVNNSQKLKPLDIPSRLLSHNLFLNTSRKIRHPDEDINILFVGMSPTNHLQSIN
jgi:hypothetical protein